MSDQHKALGKRIRSVRQSHNLTVRALAVNSGLSPAFISQIENGKANPSFDAVRKVAAALGLTFADLFDPTPTPTGKVLRKGDRPQILTDSGVINYQITRQPVADVEVAVSEYQPGSYSGGPDYRHGNSREVVVILSGKFSFLLGEETFILEEGDSMDFRTNIPHMITNVGTEVGEALWAVGPPSVPQDRGRAAADSEPD